MARRLAAILAADVVGYSRLMAADEAGTHARLKALRHALIEPKIAEHHGRIVKLIGDGALVEFASVVDAVECAAAIQEGVAERQAELPEDRRIALRIGINIGDVIIDGDDIYGDGVNVAARLEQLAEPGEICVARNVYNQVKAKIAFGFEPRGEHRVKNIPEPITVYRVITEPGALAKVLRIKRASTPRWRVAALAAAAVGLLVAAGATAWLQPWRAQERLAAPELTTGAAALPEDPVLAIPTGPSIAVLPLDNLSGDPEQEYFADGLTEDIITKFTRFRELLVIARNSTYRYKGQQVDVRQVGRDLGVRYVLEGSVRKASDEIRVTVQLIDTHNAAHLWAESYEANLTVSNIFAIQDDLTNKITNIVADAYGVLARTDLKESKKKAPATLVAYDCVLRGYAYLMLFTSDAHRDARDCLERAVELDPNYSDAWAWLSWMYQDEYLLNFNPQPASLDRAFEAARRAVNLDQVSNLAHHLMAVCHFLRWEDELFVIEAERALAINSNNAALIGDLGIFLIGAGEWERGMALVNKAMRLNPYHGGILYEPLFKFHYQRGEYEEALRAARAMNMPGHPNYWRQLAAVYGQLGRQEEANAAIARLLELEPDFVANAWEELFKGIHVVKFVEHFIEGLRKAGLDIPSNIRTRPRLSQPAPAE